MCGIFGFAKKEYPLSELERFKLQGAILDLMVLNERRGRDGTGFFLLSRKEAALFKEPKPSSALIKTKRLKKFLRKISGETTVCLGHTRFATVGEVSKENCHPFLSKDFAGVHNGHFLNRAELLERYGASQTTTVDSEAIFKVLDGAGNPEEIARRLSEMTGDFALGFVSVRNPHALYLIRNQEKPLHAAYLPSMKTLLWSSEESHLEYALARNSLKGFLSEIPRNVLYEVNLRRFGKRCAARTFPCEMKYPAIEYGATSWEADDWAFREAPDLRTYEELRAMGFTDQAGIMEYSKLSCSLCEEFVEAGRLFYDEVTGRSFCEPCSFDYLARYEEAERMKLEERTRDAQYQCV